MRPMTRKQANSLVQLRIKNLKAMLKHHNEIEWQIAQELWTTSTGIPWKITKYGCFSVFALQELQLRPAKSSAYVSTWDHVQRLGYTLKEMVALETTSFSRAAKVLRLLEVKVGKRAFQAKYHEFNCVSTVVRDNKGKIIARTNGNQFGFILDDEHAKKFTRILRQHGASTKKGSGFRRNVSAAMQNFLDTLPG